MNYLDLSITEIHEALLAKKVTPLELTQEAIARAKANQDNCFEAFAEEEALAFASSLIEPEKDNLLWGIPYLCKDNISTKGIATCASSEILSGYIPVFDAAVVEKLKEKKAVLLGKTTLDELAMGGTGSSGHKGKTYNPYDPSHTRQIGGSSCGSAAAVAAGIVPFSLGSDTGDSVRKPAAYGGLVGLKPTWSRISRYGLFPFSPSFDHVGFFTRGVEDAAILLGVMAGRDDRDATSSSRSVDDYLGHLKDGPKGLKIAVIDEVLDSFTDPFIQENFASYLSALEQAGIEVGHVHLPKSLLSSVLATYYILSSAEATSNNANLDGIKFGPYYEGQTYEEVMRLARTNGFSEPIKRRFVLGSFALMRENQEELFLRAKKNRAKVVDYVNQILKDYDFIFAPTAPNIAPRFDEQVDRLSDEYLIAESYLAIGNFGGYPCISLPSGMKEGFPIGIHLMGSPFKEADLLRLSYWLEEQSGLRGLSVLTKGDLQ